MVRLRVRLDLSPARASLRRDVDAATTEVATADRDFCARLPASPGSSDLPGRLALLEQGLSARQQKIGSLPRKFYGAVSPAQRGIADRILAPPALL